MGGPVRDSTLALRTPSPVHAIPHALEQKAVMLLLLGPVGWGTEQGPRSASKGRRQLASGCAARVCRAWRQSPRKPKGTHGQMEGKTSAELGP